MSWTRIPYNTYMPHLEIPIKPSISAATAQLSERGDTPSHKQRTVLENHMDSPVLVAGLTSVVRQLDFQKHRLGCDLKIPSLFRVFNTVINFHFLKM